jgi:hypothetical protein
MLTAKAHIMTVTCVSECLFLPVAQLEAHYFKLNGKKHCLKPLRSSIVGDSILASESLLTHILSLLHHDKCHSV